jgi:hypothetical protein
MMNTMGKMMFGIGALTIMLLFYVHEQVALFRVSYEIDTQSETLARMAEEYRYLKFELEQLKAPRLLEEKMKQLSLDLALPQEIRVVRTPAPVLDASVQEATFRSPSERMFQFLGRWVDVAQAKTDN